MMCTIHAAFTKMTLLKLLRTLKVTFTFCDQFSLTLSGSSLSMELPSALTMQAITIPDIYRVRQPNNTLTDHPKY